MTAEDYAKMKAELGIREMRFEPERDWEASPPLIRAGHRSKLVVKPEPGGDLSALNPPYTKRISEQSRRIYQNMTPEQREAMRAQRSINAKGLKGHRKIKH